MREIKFRAWHTLVKVMYKPTDLEAYSMALLRLPQDGHFELMQYTGLKDKNSKEIYEGDKVKYHTYDGYIGITEVKYIDGCFYPVAIGNEPTRYDGKGFEVIGNIYEKPELLEVGNVDKQEKTE